jgi:hypothetical protein
MGLIQSLNCIEKNNAIIDIKYNIFIDKLQKQHEYKIKKLNEQIKNLDDRIERIIN